MTVQRVSVALQRAIGEAAVLFNRRTRAFPAVAMGPAAEEHAATWVAPTLGLPSANFSRNHASLCELLSYCPSNSSLLYTKIPLDSQ